jgi:hypothetical protein
MTELKRVWAGMLTDERRNSGSDSPVVLIINERGGELDALHYTFPDTAQRDQERGQANLYEIKEEDFETRGFVGRTVDPQDLNVSSIRVGIRGNDFWRPKSFFVWGEQRDEIIVPLALETDMQRSIGIAGQLNDVGLSTDPSEGKLSFAPGQVQSGSAFTVIRRLLMVLTTADEDDAGTDDKIELQISTSDGHLVVNHVFTDTSQDDLERGQANLYYVPASIPFTRSELNADSIRLGIKGNDAWLPDRLFLFGLDDEQGNAESIVPLVHLPTWPFRWLSTDRDEGEDSVTLPLVDTVLLRSSNTGQS